MQVHGLYLVNMYNSEYFNSKELFIYVKGQKKSIAGRKEYEIIDKLLDYSLNDNIDVNQL